MQNNGRKGKKSKYAVFLCGVTALLTGIWLYSQTWGLRLLSVNVWVGRISRFYGVFLLIGCVCFIIGFWLTKHMDGASGKKIDVEAAKENSVQISAKTEQIKNRTNCPVCGKINDPLNKFCTFCGSRIGETE